MAADESIYLRTSLVGLLSGNRNVGSDSFMPLAILYPAELGCRGNPDNWPMPALAVDLVCADGVLSVKLDLGEIASSNSSRSRMHRLRLLIKGLGTSAKGVGQEDLRASMIVSTSSSESTTSASVAGVADDAAAITFFGIRSLAGVTVCFCNNGEAPESVKDTALKKCER